MVYSAQFDAHKRWRKTRRPVGICVLTYEQHYVLLPFCLDNSNPLLRMPLGIPKFSLNQFTIRFITGV